MSDLARKTIRPGSLNSFSYYHSGPRPTTTVERAPAKPQNRNWLIAIVVILLLFGFIKGGHSLIQPSASDQQNAPVISDANATATNSSNPCQGTTSKLIKVSINQRREWACQAGKVVHTNAVITGLRNDPQTETPPGTYKIYAKQTNTTLTGSDDRGTWRDPVYYWMPFLSNQYGTYGFHDATWRNNSAFGKIGPDSQDASHGCVELPLSDSKWLYNWAEVGTTVTIES